MRLSYQETKDIHIVEVVILDKILNASQTQVQYCLSSVHLLYLKIKKNYTQDYP